MHSVILPARKVSKRMIKMRFFFLLFWLWILFIFKVLKLSANCIFLKHCYKMKLQQFTRPITYNAMDWIGLYRSILFYTLAFLRKFYFLMFFRKNFVKTYYFEITNLHTPLEIIRTHVLSVETSHFITLDILDVLFQPLCALETIHDFLYELVIKHKWKSSFFQYITL